MIPNNTVCRDVTDKGVWVVYEDVGKAGPREDGTYQRVYEHVFIPFGKFDVDCSEIRAEIVE